MYTWCNTGVILFGGASHNSDGLRRILNDTWLFDGMTETWIKQDVKLWRVGDFVLPRYYHKAVSIRQPLSNCTCQESILVYCGLSSFFKVASDGGPSCLRDLWEMRCIADSNGKQQFYWISLARQGDALWQSAADFNKSSMYMWLGDRCHTSKTNLFSDGIWEYDLTDRMWKHHTQITNHIPLRCVEAFANVVNYESSFFYSSFLATAVTN